MLKGGRQREQAILEVLRYVQPDLAVLQEVRDSRPVEDWARSLGMRVWTTAERSPFRLALMSRLPVTFWQTHRPFPPAISTPFSGGGGGVLLRRTPPGLRRPPGPVVQHSDGGLAPVGNPPVLQKARAYLQDLCLLLGDFNTIGPSDTTDVRAMPLPLR
ncbi:MAG: endonuclease/exonuclease/phosphatase family protein, partial [Anaerolineae bacterium]|nr:endonuclease/exonuclease/phosphatase family protein [Anaerolineae bacterium]